jgi:hypothetical protein
LLTNQMHALTTFARAERRKEWRGAGTRAAQMYKLPKMTRIALEVQTRYPNRKSLPDTDAPAPALKGILDGLVQRGVLPNDTGEHVMWVRYWPPLVEPGVPALLVTITDRSDG